LGEIGKLYTEPLSKQHIVLTVDVAPALPLLEGSRDKLKQVFINLISNARDAMPNGGSIRIWAAAARGGLSITVSDTGAGIPPENIRRVFDAFFTTKKELSGVGLGLSVSYGIIQQHKGSIEVQSVVGQGTTFTIQLPTMR
jgi:two-component system NtrC family sensor kinase